LFVSLKKPFCEEGIGIFELSFLKELGFLEKFSLVYTKKEGGLYVLAFEKILSFF